MCKIDQLLAFSMSRVERSAGHSRLVGPLLPLALTPEAFGFLDPNWKLGTSCAGIRAAKVKAENDRTVDESILSTPLV